jgi:hypothetical protein
MNRNIFTLLLLYLSSTTIYSQIFFEDQATILGLAHTSGDVNLGSGVSFFDYNGDGWDDITLCTDNGASLKFLKNVNGMYVEDTIEIPNLSYQTKQVNWVDFDNDGDKDLFVTSDANYNKLFENDGNLNFTDITTASGLPLVNMFTYGASWGDIDNDGFLDVFISNRDASYTHTNKLFKNNGDGTFSDITIIAGVDESRLSFCAAFFDYNNDGWQDIYVANDKDYTANLLYENNGDGTFADVSQQSQTDIMIDAMSTTIGDFDNDGWFDIYVTNAPPGNALLRNNGDGTFTDVADISGTSFNSFAWGAVFLDADLDRDLDLYVSGAFDFETPCCLPSAFYENIGSDTFELNASNGFTGDLRVSYANAIGDVDNDGLPEIVVTNNLNENMFLWKNETNTQNNYLNIKLEGVLSNKDGIGSKIEIAINGDKQYRYTLCGEGYLSQNSNTEFFGLGDTNTVDYVKVNWPSGTEDIFYNVTSNQTITIVEGQELLSVPSFEAPVIALYPTVFNDHINLKTTETGRLRIFNLLGKQVYKAWVAPNMSAIEIKLSYLESGMYIAQWSQNDTTTSFKLLKE